MSSTHVTAAAEGIAIVPRSGRGPHCKNLLRGLWHLPGQVQIYIKDKAIASPERRARLRVLLMAVQSSKGVFSRSSFISYTLIPKVSDAIMAGSHKHAPGPPMRRLCANSKLPTRKSVCEIVPCLILKGFGPEIWIAAEKTVCRTQATNSGEFPENDVLMRRPSASG